MSFILNINLVMPETVQSRFTIWFKNKIELKNKKLFKVYSSNQDGQVTLNIQEVVASLAELQLKTAHAQGNFKEILKKDFKEDIYFFTSALERLD